MRTSLALFKRVVYIFLGLVCLRSAETAESDTEGQALIDVYPNTRQVPQGTTVVMVCHASGIPSDTTVTYQWSCPNYGCDARGLQSDGNIVSRREEGNTIAIDVVNDTDSGDYTCNVRSSGRVLGTATYRIDSVTPALVLTGREGMIPLNGFAVTGSKPSISTPFNETRGNYIRCGWLGRQLEWHRSGRTLTMTAGSNEYFFRTTGTAELWQSIRTPGPNEEYGCRGMGSRDITNLTGLFFRSNTDIRPGQPTVTDVSILTTSIQLSWTQNINNGRYYVSYERIDLPIAVTHHFIRNHFAVTSVTIPDLTPGATYKIQVWSSRSPAAPIGPPYEMDVTTEETAPTAPRLLTVARNTSTSIDLNWIPPRHPNGVIHYEIEYSTSGSFVESTTINTRINSTYHKVPDVREFPRHYFRVVAVNSAGVGKSASSNIIEVCLGTEVVPSPPTNTKVFSTDINTTAISWTAPILGVKTCKGEEQFTYTVTVSHLNGSLVTNVTRKKTTVDIRFCMINSVSVFAWNSIGTSEPDVWRNQGSSLDNVQCPSSSNTVPQNSGPIAAAVAVVIVLLIVLVVVVISVIICVIVIRKRKEKEYAITYKPTNSNKSYTSKEEPMLSTGRTAHHVKEGIEDVDSLDVVVSTKEDMQIYQNMAISVPKHKPIPVGKFPQHVEAMFSKGKNVITNEFKSIETMIKDSISAGEANKTKNRYKNIFPYDHSRVVLSVTGSNSCDYINASYIDGYKRTNAFIAAQGPTVATLRDFCQMIWDVRTTMVVMVTKVVEGTKRKCEQYYPERVGETLTFGPYSLKTRTITHYVDFEVRTIELSSEETDDRHAFDHYLFTGWPDYGVPQYPTSLIRMLYHVREHRISDIPIIVHCSAGVGRTGTFIALDYILDQISAEKTVDIKGVVRKIREKRMCMVQTSDQYTFLYTAVRELLLCGDTIVRATDLRRFIAESRKDGFKAQFKILGKLTQPSDNAEKVMDSMDKVRYRDRLPAKGKHLYVPLNGRRPVFINATFVDGYHAPKAFIAAQSPMATTVTEFWSMIVDKKVTTVVLLCPLWETKKKTCHMFWPQTEQEQVDYGDEYSVTLVRSESDSLYDVHHLTMSINNRSKQFSVTLFHYKQWEEGSKPNNVSLIKCLMAAQQEQLKQSTAAQQPTVVACNDGLGRSCTFIAIWSLLEQMKTEGQIDVLSTVKSIRTQRPGAMNHLEYYSCCYDALVDYVDTFEGYSNFRA